MSEILPLVQTPVLRDRVYETLESLIVDRTLPPGQRLVEGDLAERLGVSRNPVREALGMLARDGWVEVRARFGTFVRQPSPKEITDFFELRAVLEAFMGREAARNASLGAIAELRATWERGVLALENDDVRGLIDANAEFHDRVLALADNGLLTQTVGIMRKRLVWYFAPIAEVHGGRSWDEHLPIIEALARGDSATSARLLEEHARHVEATYRAGGAGGSATTRESA